MKALSCVNVNNICKVLRTCALVFSIFCVGLAAGLYIVVVQLRNNQEPITEEAQRWFKWLIEGVTVDRCVRVAFATAVVGIVVDWMVRRILTWSFKWIVAKVKEMRDVVVKSQALLLKILVIIGASLVFRKDIKHWIGHQGFLMLAAVGVAIAWFKGSKLRSMPRESNPGKAKGEKRVAVLKYADLRALLDQGRGAEVQKILTTFDEILWIDTPQVYQARAGKMERRLARKRALSESREPAVDLRTEADPKIEKELDLLLPKEAKPPARRRYEGRRRVEWKVCPTCGKKQPPQHKCWVVYKRIRCFRCKGYNHIAVNCRNNASGMGMYVRIAADMQPEDLRKEYGNIKKLMEECERVCKLRGMDVSQLEEEQKKREQAKPRNVTRAPAASADPPQVAQAGREGRKGVLPCFRLPEVAGARMSSTTSGLRRLRSN